MKQPRSTAKARVIRFFLLIAPVLLVQVASGESPAPVVSYYSNSNGNIPADSNKPAVIGFIVPTAEPVPGGAKIKVDLYYTKYNTYAYLSLQAAVNDGNGKVEVIPLKVLSGFVSDNPGSYHNQREFTVSYKELNDLLAKHAPGAKNLEIGSGTPLFVKGQYSDSPTGQVNVPAGQFVHKTGSVERGGIVFMPDDPAHPAQALSQPLTAGARRPSELDIAYRIQSSLSNPYNTVGTDPQGRTVESGLKTGGFIRSRVESEGKFQIPLEQADQVKRRLFALADDPAQAHAVLGPDWEIEKVDRYYKKSASSGRPILGADGYPIPDPMVDTYYDDDGFDAAKNDMAIRYRWTEGNQTGAWGFKPGLTKRSPEGVVDRVEYGVDTTDDHPGTIAKFVDSDNPLNPFKLIRSVVPGKNPSEFLKPSVRITDTRYKFLLKHKSGLKIEASLDNAEVTALRSGAARPSAKFVQMEMDVDHLGIQSMNTAKATGVGGIRTLGAGADVENIDDHDPFLKGLGPGAFFDGSPVIHGMADLDPNSPVKTAHAQDFQLADQAVAKLRDAVIGKNWLPGPQKYALGATAVGLVPPNEESASVKALDSLHQQKNSGSHLVSVPVVSCAGAFD